jgi:hypothetical protein
VLVRTVVQRPPMIAAIHLATAHINCRAGPWKTLADKQQGQSNDKGGPMTKVWVCKTYPTSLRARYRKGFS